MTPPFSVTWDYRCPFARIAHEHVLAGLEGGARWNVAFKAFSLDQAHLDQAATPVWEEPERYPGLTANLAGIAIRDGQPDRFLDVHAALFRARHVHSIDLRDRTAVGKVLDEAGVDGAGALSEVDSGRPLDTLREEHTWAAERLHVFGVPTFVVGDVAVFVRLMKGPDGDADLARRTIDRVLDSITGWPDLNEFKHTTLVR